MTTEPLAMAQSLSQNYIHLIFSSKNREPWLEPAVQGRLYPYLVGAFAGQESPSVKIGGVADHVHALFRAFLVKHGVEYDERYVWD